MSSNQKKTPAVRHRTTQISAAHSHWSGPLPPPEALEKFNQVIGGSADRILKMAEDEQAHRHAMDLAIAENGSFVSEANAKAQIDEASAIRRGHYLGTLVSVVATVSAVVSVYIGAHPTVSVALIGVPLMGAVRAIVLRK